MSLHLVCVCGKQLRISEEHSGRQVKCPSCGKVQVAPSATGITTAPAATPGSSGRGLMLLLVPLLLAAIVGGWWYLRKDKGGSNGELTDLSLIPGDAQGFVSIRLADLWNAPAMKQVLEDARKKDPKTPDLAAQLELNTSLRPEDVERISFAGVTVNLEQSVGWGVVKTLKPYDRNKILTKLHHQREHVHDGKFYVIGVDQAGRETSLYFVNPKVLLVGNQEGIKRAITFLDSATRAAEGPLTPILKLCAEAKHQIVAGVHPGPDAAKMVQGKESLADLAELRLGQLTVDVDKQAVIEARVQTSGEAQAKKVHGTVNTYLSAAKVYLFGLSWKGGAEGKAASELSKLLGQLKLEQQGNDLNATLTTDPASIAPALMMLPNLLGR